MSTSTRPWLGYATAWFLFTVIFVFTYRHTILINNYTQEVKKSNEALTQLNNLNVNIKNIEYYYRTYILTKDSSAQIALSNQHNTIQQPLQSIKILLTNNAQVSVNKLIALTLKYKHTAQEAMAFYRNNNYKVNDSMQQYSLKLLRIMDEINLVISDINHEQQIQLTEKLITLKEATRILKAVNIGLFITASLLAFYSFLLYYKEFKSRKAAYLQLESKVKDLEEANQQLSALRSLEKFTATGRIARVIAHEVRNPLSNINLAAEQVKQKNEDKEAVFLLDLILRNSNRINTLISELLDSTRFQDLNMAKASVNQVLEEALEISKDHLAFKHISIIKKFASTPCEVFMDADKIRIAFTNLIINAVDAMTAYDGILTIETFEQENDCTIIITDNGTGIEEAYLSRLFEPYFSQKIKGAGLGLTNTQNIIYNHQGSIEVSSKINAGTSFTIHLLKNPAIENM